MIGVYWLWHEKEQIAQKTQDLKYQFIFFKENVKTELEETKIKYQELLQQNKELQQQLQMQEVEINKPKELKIILPQDINYTKEIDSQDKIVTDINLSNELQTTQDEKYKITPEVFIDKEEKKLEGVKINIETKF